MPFEDLREFLHALEKRGELKRVALAADPYLEIAAFADRSVKTGGPALLFENPTGSNVRSSSMPSRVFAACKSPWRGRHRRHRPPHRRLHRAPKARGPSRKAQAASEARRSHAAFRKPFRRTCKEVIRRKDFSLDEFPILHCWPGDAGRFITLPLVFSRDPKTGKRNCGMYRMQVFDGQTTGMHWQKHKQGADHYRRLAAEATRPACPSPSPLAPIPPPSFPPFFAAARGRRNALRRLPRNKAVEMVKCETNDLDVPPTRKSCWKVI